MHKDLTSSRQVYVLIHKSRPVWAKATLLWPCQYFHSELAEVINDQKHENPRHIETSQ